MVYPSHTLSTFLTPLNQERFYCSMDCPHLTSLNQERWLALRIVNDIFGILARERINVSYSWCFRGLVIYNYHTRISDLGNVIRALPVIRTMHKLHTRRTKSRTYACLPAIYADHPEDERIFPHSAHERLVLWRFYYYYYDIHMILLFISYSYHMIV